MGLLLGLLCFVIVLAIFFWLLRMIVGGIPGAPAWLAPAIIAVFALFALCWLFGGYSPFYGPHVALFR